MWQCNALFDPAKKSCRVIANPGACYWLSTDASEEWCHRKWAAEPQYRLADHMRAVWKHARKTNQSEQHVMNRLRHKMAKYPYVLAYLDVLLAIGQVTDSSALEVDDIDSPSKPSFTEEMLRQTCRSHINTITVADSFLDGENLGELRSAKLPWWGHGKYVKDDGTIGTAPKDPTECDHTLYLQSCNFDRNEFVLWTWGTTYVVSKEILVGTGKAPHGEPFENTGVVCYAVVADHVTVQ